jgi:hypothetical protein
MAAKLVSLRSNLLRHVSSIFSDYFGEICDLVLAISVVRFAEAEQRAQSGADRARAS